MKIIRWLMIALVIIAMGFPFIIMISVSLQTMPEIYRANPVLVPAIPQWSNYAAAMHNGNWARYMWNSAYISVLTTVISLVINAMAGYVFARLSFKFKRPLFAIVLLGLMIPPQVTMVPVFTMLRATPFAGGNDAFGRGGLGLMNTYAGLILPYVAGTFGAYLCRQYYISFPGELDDAAKIDGCSRLRAFVKIYLPLSGPILASLGVIKFTGTWNEFTWPLIMTHSEDMRTVQIALTMFRDEAEIRWNLLMAATLVSSSVVYVVFLFAQKYFVAGLLAGSVKG